MISIVDLFGRVIIFFLLIYILYQKDFLVSFYNERKLWRTEVASGKGEKGMRSLK